MNRLSPILFSYLLMLFFIPGVFAQEKTVKTDPEPIRWITFEQAVELSKTHPKKIFIDVYTDWCGWCKKMDKLTFSDSAITALMNQDYYAVKFNAESKAPVTFREQTFEFKPEYKAHELAIALLDGKMSYPHTVFLDEQFNLLTRMPGFLTTDQLSPILRYFGKDIYKEQKWEEFSKSSQ